MNNAGRYLLSLGALLLGNAALAFVLLRRRNDVPSYEAPEPQASGGKPVRAKQPLADFPDDEPLQDVPKRRGSSDAPSAT